MRSPATTTGAARPRRAALSAYRAADHPEWIFYASQAGVLKVWDTSLATPANVGGTGTANPPSGVTWSTNFNAMAFAPDGTLWAAAGSSMFYLTPADVTSFLAGGTVTWKAGTAFLRRSTMSTGYYAIGDIAFDGNGNLWFVGTHSGETTGQGDVGMLLSTELKMGNTTAYSVTKWAKIATGYGNNLLPRGLAFRGNKLYMGVGSTNTTDELREIYWTSVWNGTTWNGTPTTVMSADLSNTSTNNIPVPSDFASCSFPKATDVSGPAFKVQKSVVNPDGTVAPAGGTSPQTVKINADGTFTVKYLITVTAIGTTSGTPNSITDNLTVPAGFTVTSTTLALLGGTPAAVTSPFTISAATIGTLDPLGTTAPISKTYEVTVSLKTNNPTAANWTSIGTCNTTSSGTPGTGVFNAVTMTGDADTTDNDACITATSARLNLVKQIVSANGTQVTGSTDSQYFDLIAGGPTGFLDKSLTSGEVGTPTYVVPGTYRLGEQGNDGGTTSGLYQLYATWSCIDLANANAAVPVTNGAIVVNANMNVQCVIKNTKTPKVHIVKTATTPIAGNSHIGTTITPNPDGTFVATYTITVTNTSGFTTNTGAITDGFLVPAGLLWDGTKTATVTYNANGTGATASGLVAGVTRAQLATWATLATSVQSLPNNAAVTFTIAIPLKLDLSVPSGSTTTVYASNATSLGQCQSMSSSSGGPYTTMTAGIPNMTALVDEDLTYSTIAIEDNIACVPVVASTTWKVEKHPEGDANDGANDGLGPTTTATYDAVTNTFSATVKYFVTVTNSGNFPGTNPAVTDTVTLAPGFAITALSVQGVDKTFTAGSSTATFTIPAGTTALAGGQSVTYTVIVTGRGNPTPTQWTQAGTCNVSGAGTAGSGFFNQVTLTGDTDGVNNNDACVPVVEPTRVITVQKYASTCDVNVPTCSLGGAQFDVYSVDPRTLGAVPITQGIGPDAVPPTGYAPGSTFTSTSLHYGVDYWLVERNAPTGYSLLADPIKFRLTDTGIVLPPDPADATVNNSGTVRIVGNQFTVTIIDPQQGRLPVSGGAGPLPFLAIGLLIALGASWHLRKVSVQVAPRRAL